MISKQHAVSFVFDYQLAFSELHLKADQDDIKHSDDKCCVTTCAQLLCIT